MNFPLLPEIWFAIVLAVLFVITTFLTARGSLTDNRFTRKWYKRINNRGWGVIIINGLIILILVIQYHNNNNWIRHKDAQLKLEQDTRTEIIQNGVNEKTSELFDKISRAFANQGIKIDSLNEIIETIENNNYTTNNFINESEPYFVIKTNSLKTYPDQIRFRFESLGAASTNFKVDMWALTKWNDSVVKLEKKAFLHKNARIPANMEVDASLITIKKGYNVKNIQEIYALLRGTYSNLNKSKTYTLDALYGYDSEGNLFLELIGPKKDSILSLMVEVSTRPGMIKKI